MVCRVLNCPGSPRRLLVESGGECCRFLQGFVAGGFGFSRWHMADRLKKPAVVESVDPFERGIRDARVPLRGKIGIAWDVADAALPGLRRGQIHHGGGAARGPQLEPQTGVAPAARAVLVSPRSQAQ